MVLETLWVFWKRHQHQAGYIIVGLLLFVAGWQFGRVTSPYYASHPIVFQEAPDPATGGASTPPNVNNGSVEALGALKEAGEQKSETAQVAAATTISPAPSPAMGGASAPVGERVYVGSKNSDLYHHYSCPTAKRIKEVNQIWWSTKEAAETAGYKPSKCTIELKTTN
jgi:hypothetical protein